MTIGLAGQTDRVRCAWRCTVSRPSRGRFHICLCYCGRDFCGGGWMRAFLRIGLASIGASLALAAAAVAQKPSLLPERDVAALANELSGETAKRNLEGIARFHRQRGSRGFHEAAELVAERLRAYGLSDVAILQFPADGKIFYGTQRSRPAWDAEVGELWEVKEVKEVKEAKDKNESGDGQPAQKMASYEAQPIVLAEDSESADVTADLVDAGEGVKAGQHAGNYEVVTATIPGSDAKLKDEEIAFSCHLDHQRPGANDNASGCVTILEVARTLQKLMNERKLARPARTIRFYWPPETEGTMALLTSPPRTYKMELDTKRSFDGAVPLPQSGGGSLTQTGPTLAKRVKAVIHMDMVGGAPETKAVFHVTRGPMSLPSFAHDVAWAFAEFVNEESYKFAATGKADYPFVAPEGGKESLRAEYSPYTMGSDHDVYQDSSFGIPAIYLNDWPDRYIHTNFDMAANIDATKLKRAAFTGAASGYFLSSLTTENFSTAKSAIEHGNLWREQVVATRRSSLSDREIACAADYALRY